MTIGIAIVKGVGPEKETYGDTAEGDMGKPIADQREPPQHKKGPQHGTQHGDETTRYECPLDKAMTEEVKKVHKMPQGSFFPIT